MADLTAYRLGDTGRVLIAYDTEVQSVQFLRGPHQLTMLAIVGGIPAREVESIRAQLPGRIGGMVYRDTPALRQALEELQHDDC